MFCPSIKKLASFAALAFIVSASCNVYAAGFSVLEQGAKHIGSALAGTGSSASDATAAWYNPAAMSLLGNEVSLNASLIEPHINYTDIGSTQSVGGSSIPLLPTGVKSTNAGVAALVPSLFYVHRLGANAHFGFTLNAPFGLETRYNPQWTGRYQAIESKMEDINFNPVLSYALNKHFSVGVGASVNYLDAHLTNAIDFAAVCAQVAGGACPNGAVPGQGSFDGYAVNKGNDVGFGYNLGALWRITPYTRVGFSYRSQIHHTLDGSSTFVPPATLGGFAALGQTGTVMKSMFYKMGNEAPLVLPASATLSFYHRIPMASGHNLTLMANADWTQWSVMKNLTIKFNDPTKPVSSQLLNWQDVWRFSLGADYKLNSKWVLRTGVAYDQSPVRNDALRSPRIPGSDRTWLAVGATRKITPTTSVDFALTHDYVHDAYIHHMGATGDMLNGHYGANANTISVQFNHTL